MEVATPILSEFGYAVEAQGRSWAHWTRGFQNVIRAYARSDADGHGIIVVGQGEIPDGVGEALANRVPKEAPGFCAKPS